MTQMKEVKEGMGEPPKMIAMAEERYACVQLPVLLVSHHKLEDVIRFTNSTVQSTFPYTLTGSGRTVRAT